MGWFSGMFASKKKPQKWSIHRGVRTGQAPQQSAVTKAIKAFYKAHPKAEVDAVTSQFVGTTTAFIWVWYRE